MSLASIQISKRIKMNFICICALTMNTDNRVLKAWGRKPGGGDQGRERGGERGGTFVKLLTIKIKNSFYHSL